MNIQKEKECLPKIQGNKILFRTIVGSQSYGTNIEKTDTQPGSDVDYKGVYAQSTDELIGFGYKEQINTNKDDTSYEIRRFIELLETANPTVLEMLYSPEDCIVEKDPAFDILIKHRDKFLTKKCLHSFGGYAIAQIKKAKGLDKKMNWEKDRVTRKTPLDFVYVHVNGKTIPISEYIDLNDQHKYGLVALDHFKDCYAMYYDYTTDQKLGYRGIIEDDSNEVRLSSVPKGQNVDAIIYYNKDGYSMHCKDYKEYTEWLNNRNTQRYVDLENHNQKIDGKNMLHCRRLLDMAMEIAQTGNIQVRRPNAEYLLKIRRGQVPLNDIIEQAEIDIKALDELYKNSSLPDKVDKDIVNNILLEIRHALK